MKWITGSGKIRAMLRRKPEPAPKLEQYRKTLPERRPSEQYKFEVMGFTWYATIGYYEDGSPGELFLATAKTGEMGRLLSADAAVAVSLALQYGCPAQTLIDAMTADSYGEPVSPVSLALSKVAVRSPEVTERLKEKLA